MAGTILKIARSGDILLIPVIENDDEVQVLASSHALAAISLVFAKMFSPIFQEGRDLNPAKPKKIELPEDSLRPLEVLSNIAHFRNGSVPLDPSIAQISIFAALVDKYQCSEATRFVAKFWFDKILKQTLSGWDMLLLLNASYLLDNPHSFQVVSAHIILHLKCEDTILLSRVGELALPLNASLEMQYLRNKSFQIIFEEIQQTVMAYVNSKHNNRCDLAKDYTFQVSESIKTVNLCLVVGSSSTLADVLAKVELFCTHIMGKSHPDCRCYLAQVINKETIRAALSKTVKSIQESGAQGLCLDCIKAKGRPDAPACRIKHPEHEARMVP